MEITAVKIKCGIDVVEVPIDDIGFSARSDECELCGSHGDVTVEVRRCPNCGKSHDIEVESW
jgi:transposase